MPPIFSSSRGDDLEISSNDPMLVANDLFYVLELLKKNEFLFHSMGAINIGDISKYGHVNLLK
jgi:hypothetical protein